MYRSDYRLLTTTKGLEIIKKNCKDELLLEKIENETDKEEKNKLGQELNSIILKLVKIK